MAEKRLAEIQQTEDVRVNERRVHRRSRRVRADSKTLFEIVTAPAWRDRFAALHMEAERLKDEMSALNKLLNWHLAAQRNPGNLILLLEDKKPKKMGRYANREEEIIQRAWDVAAYHAVEDLMERDGLKQTPAEEKTGKALGLSRQAVHGAWLRERDRLSQN